MILRLVLSACASVALLAACDSSKPAAETTAPAAKNGKVYRVVTERVKPPMVAYVDGKITGFEYDLLQAIAAKKGISFEYQVVDSKKDLLPALESGKADIAAGAITINDERRQKVNFSEPILDYSAAVLVDKSLADAKSFADLKGKSVAVGRGTVYDKMAADYLASGDGKNIVYYDTVWEQVKNLLNHQTQVVLGDSLILEYYLQQNGSHQAVFVQNISFPKESYGFALAKNNTELQQEINDGLEKIREDGTYAKIYQTYWQKNEQR